MYCLDTDIIIEFLRGNKKIISKIKEKSNGLLFLTTLSLCELYKGAFLSSRKEKEVENIQTLLTYFGLITITNKTAEIFGKTYKTLTDSGKLTQEFDLLNASITMTHDFILVTRNKKHFINISDLKIEEW